MNICYHGAVYNCSGYAQIRHLFLRLYKKGFNVKIKPYRSRDNVKLLYEKDFKLLENTQFEGKYINIASGIAPQLVLDTDASYNIAYSMFETTEVPERWIELYNNFDEVWVPSSFCKKTYNRKDLSCPVRVIPMGVDESLYCNKHKKNQKETFTFLATGQWIDRKGWDLLIKSYISEFMGQFDVRLCIKTYNDKKTNEEMIREYLDFDIKNSTYMPRIMIKNEKVDEINMPFFYNEADCYILPSRGEAFNLPALEAMSSSLPVIVSDFGGHLDFVNEDFSWLVPVKRLSHLSERLCKINSAYKDLWFAEPEISDIRKIMRYVYENRDEVKEKGAKARKYVEENLFWDKATDLAEERLKQIWVNLN